MRAVRVGICVLLAFAVLAHGAVEPWSESVLEIGAAILFVYWGILFTAGATVCLRWNWLLAPVAGFLAFAMLQYVARLSEVAFFTRIEILKLSALAILMFLAVQAYETLEQWHGFVWFLLVLGFLVSAFGILQHFTFNGKLYWFREMRYGGIPFGPFVNRNHFAGLVELIIPSGLSIFLLRAENEERLPLLGILTLLPIGALFLAASRGGIVGFSVELGLILILVFARRRDRKQVVAAAMILVFTIALVAWLGVGQALDRFTSYRRLEVSESRRSEMTRDSWRIFMAHPIGGTGLGTLQEVFPRYETLYDGKIVNHSHNDYIEALAETGLLGGLCGLFYLFFLFREARLRVIRPVSLLDLALHIGSLSACCGLLVHSFVDFNLHIPSNALLFSLQSVIATSQTSSNGEPTKNR
jgi:O-antigen ligase